MIRSTRKQKKRKEKATTAIMKAVETTGGRRREREREQMKIIGGRTQLFRQESSHRNESALFFPSLSLPLVCVFFF